MEHVIVHTEDMPSKNGVQEKDNLPRDEAETHVGRLATKVWIDPMNVNGVEHISAPEQLVAQYDVLGTAPNEADRTLVAFVANRAVEERSFDPIEAEKFSAEVYEKKVQGVLLKFLDENRSPESVVVRQERQEDGSIRAMIVRGPHIQVVTVGGPGDKGNYRLETDDQGAQRLNLYKLKDKTSLFERERHRIGEYMEGADIDVVNIVGADTTNFGAGTLGSGRGGNGEFAALPTTPDKDGRKVKPHEMSTGMSK